MLSDLRMICIILAKSHKFVPPPHLSDAPFLQVSTYFNSLPHPYLLDPLQLKTGEYFALNNVFIYWSGGRIYTFLYSRPVFSNLQIIVTKWVWMASLGQKLIFSFPKATARSAKYIILSKTKYKCSWCTFQKWFLTGNKDSFYIILLKIHFVLS